MFDMIHLLHLLFRDCRVGVVLIRPGNNSRLSGIPRFDSKIFCESTIVPTLETASNILKNAKFTVRLEEMDIFAEKN